MDAASRYDRTAAPLTAVADSLSADDWAKPSPCDGWSAADVLSHLIESQRDFLIRQGVDLPLEAPSLEQEGPALAWRIHAETVARQLIDPRVGEQDFAGYFGPSTIGDTMATFYGFDMIVHRWDIARAAGRQVEWTDEELEVVERSLAQFGDAVHADGICGDPVEVAEGASRQDRLLGRLGRDPRWNP